MSCFLTFTNFLNCKYLFEILGVFINIFRSLIVLVSFALLKVYILILWIFLMEDTLKTSIAEGLPFKHRNKMKRKRIILSEIILILTRLF